MFPRAMRHFAAWLIALVAIVALGVSATAQENPPAREAVSGDDNIAVMLLADGLPKAGEEWMLALRFTPSAPEWHGYWSNPGDAGLGMELSLDLPEGWEMGEALYPVPKRLLIGDLMNHIYEGQYAVLVPVKVPADAVIEGVPDIGGFVEYLACTDKICVPQDAVLSVGMASANGSDFAGWRADIAPLLDAEARFAITGNFLRLAIPLPEAVGLDAPHVFLGQTKITATTQVNFSAVQSVRRAGDLVIVEIPLKEISLADGAEPPPFTPLTGVSGILSFGGETGVRFAAKPGEVPSGGELIAGPVGMKDTPPLWTLILGALLGGLILNIMPCVFPILSLKALSLARAGGDEATARSEGLAYTAGVVLACVALGGLMLALRAAGEQVGWAFQLQSPSVVIVLLVLAAMITANFAGLFELPSLSITQSGKPAGAFVTGLLAAFAATPCTGPFMAAALGAALLLPVPEALLLFAMLGLGLALPFLLIGFVPVLRRMLPKPGAWMERFRRLMAIPMGLTTLALIWLTVQLGGRGFALFALIMVFGILMALAVVGRLQKAGKMAWPAFGLVAAPFLIFGAFALPSSYAAQTRDLSQSILAPREFSRDALAEARALGQPVFVWFTASWCVTCKINEGVAIEREATREAFEEAGVIAMVADWTDRDEAIAAFLAEQGVAGIPLYLWYDPGAQAEQLPQVLTPDMLPSRARLGDKAPADPSARDSD
ncbi:MAG: thioredoxin family protein [Pseudomonadota bacterium]